MKSIKINQTKLSAITFGTGGNVDGDTLFKLLDKYYELGGRTVDTARMYAQLGESSEAVIGRWIKSRGVRKDIALVTKGGFPAQRANPDDIRQDMLQSVDALDATPDIYLFHRDTPAIHVSEFAELANELIKEGYTTDYGLSNWSMPRVEQMCRYAMDNQLAPPRLSQIQWSLASTNCQRMGDDTLVCMDDALLAEYERLSLPLMAFSPQAKGFFSKYAAGIPYSQKVIDRFLSEENLARAERVKRLSQKLGVSAAAVTLAYITSRVPFAVAVVGCLTEAQLEDSMTACTLELTKEDCRWLYEG